MNMRWLLVVAVPVALVPPCTVAALRWVNPPTSARIIATRRKGDDIAHEWVPLDRVAVDMRHAVVVAEDTYFDHHRGFDWHSMRAAWKHNRAHGRQRGASTITQQVAKNLFLWPGRSFLRKAIEAYLAIWIEALWPKRRILEMYLNIAQFGESIYGVEAASQRIFGRSAADLTSHNAALLAAVLPNPVRYDAGNPSPELRFRQLRVLKSLEARRAQFQEPL
ncbi:MAG TPA: monofunctional biosynthetic peptidoglycan transglycosylase [Acidimicrobiales bacterium]|nr:monofunctional biosynthetic peptidoglycan transglycosylase [Acidimicrobiales bacterium]